MRWAGNLASIVTKRNTYRILVEKREGNNSAGRPRRRCEDNIKMDLRNRMRDGKYRSDLAQDRD
jgi:hypothetical protein